MLRKIMEEKFKSSVIANSDCPRFIDIYNSSINALEKVIDTSNVPSIKYRAKTSTLSHNKNTEDIISWLQIAAKTMSVMINDYEDVSKAYLNLSTRILNDSQELNNEVAKITSMSCIYIPPSYSNQTSKSVVGKIGNYICLPFFINATEMYDGSAFIRSYSSGSIDFTNSSRINSVPLKDPLALKVSSQDKLVSVITNINIDLITANMIYIRFLNESTKIKLSLFNGTIKVYEKEFYDSEILVNFSPIEFNIISIELNYINTNTDKPFAIQLDSVEVFKRIQFSKCGQFESSPIKINNASNIENIGLSYTQLSDDSITKSTNLVSISNNPDILAYNRIDQGESLDVSVHKFRHSESFSGLSSRNVDYPRVDIAGKSFYQIDMDPSKDDLWNINYDHALVLHGLNSDYAETNEVGSGYYGQHFENWTKIGTYWRSMINITDDAVLIDIGSNECLINGRERTGKIEMKKGISMIDVHEKDIDFKMGKEIVSDMSRESDIKEDPLYPFNFAYMFSGLPEYDTNGDIEDKLLRVFQVSGVTTLFLNESFIPLSIEVSDTSQVEPYKMQLTSGVSVPGTFSIEPNSGRIKVCPSRTSKVKLQVKYRRSSFFRRPIGVMFNRLLTFMPVKALIGLENATDEQLNYKYIFDNESFFTLDGDTSKRKLLLQDTTSDDLFRYNKIQHSQLIFNRNNENLYISSKIEMETTNRYITPAIKDIYLST